MISYIVRRKETSELLGLYVAQTIGILWDAVDEIGDPSLYEWATIKNGGIYFPNDEWTEDTGELPAQPSEHLFERLIDKKARWTAFDYTDEGEGLSARIRRARIRRQILAEREPAK